MTVIVAMSTMFITGLGTSMGIAEATAILVAVAMVGSLAVLPAHLSKLGDRVERGRIAFLGGRLQADCRRSPGAPVWSAVAPKANGMPFMLPFARHDPLAQSRAGRLRRLAIDL
jgi:uncharacterized membrane protein YdfJ with MMPL/SSD domain